MRLSKPVPLVKCSVILSQRLWGFRDGRRESNHPRPNRSAGLGHRFRVCEYRTYCFLPFGINIRNSQKHALVLCFSFCVVFVLEMTSLIRKWMPNSGVSPLRISNGMNQNLQNGDNETALLSNIVTHYTPLYSRDKRVQCCLQVPLGEGLSLLKVHIT